MSYFLKWVIESTLCVLNVDLIDPAYMLGVTAPCPLPVYGSYGEYEGAAVEYDMTGGYASDRRPFSPSTPARVDESDSFEGDSDMYCPFSLFFPFTPDRPASGADEDERGPGESLAGYPLASYLGTEMPPPTALIEVTSFVGLSVSTLIQPLPLSTDFFFFFPSESSRLRPCDGEG